MPCPVATPLAAERTGVPVGGTELDELRGTTYDDGLGLRMGVSVGAELKHMDQAFCTAPVYPPAILLTGIAVNKNGDRFVAEDSYHSRTSSFVLEQPDSTAYLIVDEAHATGVFGNRGQGLATPGERPWAVTVLRATAAGAVGRAAAARAGQSGAEW